MKIKSENSQVSKDPKHLDNILMQKFHLKLLIPIYWLNLLHHYNLDLEELLEAIKIKKYWKSLLVLNNLYLMKWISKKLLKKYMLETPTHLKSYSYKKSADTITCFKSLEIHLSILKKEFTVLFWFQRNLKKLWTIYLKQGCLKFGTAVMPP